MINWINQHLGIQLNEENLDSVKNFTLIWNVFEAKVFESNFTVDNAERVLNTREFTLDELDEFLAYFSNRYVANNETNERFERLNFRPNDRKNFVRDVLIGNNGEPGNIALAIMIIIYRFRNNLFHGLKEMRNIQEQQGNFEQANNFLKMIVERF